MVEEQKGGERLGGAKKWSTASSMSVNTKGMVVESGAEAASVLDRTGRPKCEILVVAADGFRCACAFCVWKYYYWGVFGCYGGLGGGSVVFDVRAMHEEGMVDGK